MSYTISVENIKCGGCAGTITSKLKAIEGVDTVDVDIEKGDVTVGAADTLRDAIAAELLRLGYPEKGTAEGLKAAKARAKSFVSCAVGRMNSD